MDWSNKGQLITVGRDYKIKLWKTDHNLLKEIKYEGSMPTKVEWSHDGSRFVTVDYSGQILVWDAKSHQKAGKLLANPLPLSGRVVLAKKVLQEQRLIAQKKKSIFDQKTQQKNGHQKLINDANTVSANSTAIVTKSQNEIKQHQQKVNQLNGQQKGEQQKFNQLNGQRNEIANKLKQQQGKRAQLDKQIQTSNQQVANNSKVIQQLNNQINQTKEQMLKDPENEALQQRLADINGKLVKVQLELNKHKGKTAGILKQKQAADGEIQKVQKEQQTMNQSLAGHKKKIDKMIQEKKSLIDAMKKKQGDAANHRKLADQKKREAQDLQKKLPPIIEQEKKAKVDYDNFSKTLAPIQQKLQRLEKRSKS